MKRLCSGLAAALVLLLVGPVPMAQAAPATVRVFHGTTLRFRGPADRAIHLTIFENTDGLLTFKDALGRITPSPACTAVTPREVTCGHPNNRYVHVYGTPFADYIHNTVVTSIPIGILGEAGNDDLFGGPGIDLLSGGDGNDTLHGWGGTDLLYGGDGADVVSGSLGDDDLSGGPGDDQLFGGMGDDIFDEGYGLPPDTTPNGADTISGGEGTDLVKYGRYEPVSVSLDGVANDGAVGERDNVLSDVENVDGGTARDVLIGDGNNNVLIGGRGSDRLVGGGGHDELFGRQGNDNLFTADDVADRAVCGDGTDVANVDVKDHASASCETVQVA